MSTLPLNMQPQDIRLRLVIRRHGLPEVKLVWPCSRSEDLTIAKVLEQVNEVVPLESGEWGLEDYAVELTDGKGGSFECLHFQQVGRILKDEDQVIIRSLLTGDLKRRRLSGRHQISDDGRHLVDGLPFGRAWLRTPRDRPQIELPPRKRIRLSYDAEDYEDDEDDEEETHSHPVLYDGPTYPRLFDLERTLPEEDDIDLHDYHDNSSSMTYSSPPRNLVGEHDSEESEDYTDDQDEEEDDEDLETELRLLREDAGTNVLSIQSDDLNSSQDEEGEEEDEEEDDVDTDDHYGAFQPKPILRNSMQESPGPFGMATRTPATSAVPDYTNVPVEVLTTIFQTAFPELNTDIRALLSRTNKDLRKAYLSLSMLHQPVCTFGQMIDDSYFLLAPFLRRDGSGNSPELAKQAKISPLDVLKGGARKLLIEEVDEVDDFEESITNGVPISAQQMRQSQHMSSDDTSDSEFDKAKMVEGDRESDSESDSESESNSDSSEEDGQINEPRATAFPNDSSSDGSSDESSEDYSDSSSDPDASDDVQTHNKDLTVGSSDASSSESSNSDSEDDQSESASESESESESEVEEISSKQPVPSAVQQRQVTAAPRPRPQVQVADKLQGTGLTRTQKRNVRRRRLKALKELDLEQSKLQKGSEGQAMSEDFLARKEALLAALSDETRHRDSTNDEAAVKDAPTEVAPEDESLEKSTNAFNPRETVITNQRDEQAKRHARVDLGAGRRLVFGALGLKAPKNKADEKKIRDGLMKDARPLFNPRVMLDNGEDGADKEPSPDHEGENADAWRDKIVYRAVECCHEDMTLSEPPFPFVQRWDPQQQYGAMRKRKRASENHQVESFYDDSAYYYEDEAEEDQYMTETRKSSKKKKGKSAILQNGSVQRDEQDVVLDYDDAPIKSSQFTDVDDLPSLPQDVKTLPLLDPSSAQAGMVITWNQLVMSKSTNWQPEMLPATGLIVPGGENGAVHVILARRDREDNEKTYDEITGERVYSKFEVPDMDEDGGEEDTGFRSLQWAEMIEPRIVQQAPAGEVVVTSVDTAAAAVEVSMPSGHDEVSESQQGHDSLESGFSTGQVRAAIEDDLMHDSPGTHANLETASIQSGQRLPRLDLSMSEVQISTASNSFEHIGHNPRATDAHSEHVLNVGVKPQNTHSPKLNRWTEREDDTAADQEAELGPNLADAMAEEVSNSGTLASKRTESSETKREEEERNSMPDGTIIASSQFSVPSGRQPRTSYSIAEGVHDTVIPETLPQLRETSPMHSNSKSQSTPSSPDSSPFPSLEEIFMSAQATQSSGRRREASSLAASQSVPPADVDYDEAMRKLDEGHESDFPPQKQEPVEEDLVVERKLFPNATQPLLPAQLLDQDLPAPKISLSQAENSKDGKSPFAVPAGSQVIVLSSSPVSGGGVPDETNESEQEKRPSPRKRGSLPTGPGWVRKGPRHERDASGHTARGAVTAPTRASRRRRLESETLAMAPLVSPVSKQKGRVGRQTRSGSRGQ